MGDATGIKSSTSNNAVTGSAIYLLRAMMSIAANVVGGTYNGTMLGLYPRATELISGAAFVQDADGMVFDGRDGMQARGELVVVELAPAGIFAALPGGMLVNLNPLTGVSSSYPLTVAQVSNDDRYAIDTTAVASAISCSTVEASNVFSLSGCVVVLGASQSTSKLGVSVVVAYGTLSANASFDVYTPQHTSISVSDPILNRFGASGGGPVSSSCTSGGVSAYPYQKARVVAHADGLDATPLVGFAVSNSSVADVEVADGSVIVGKQPGSVTVYLGGRSGSSPSAALAVSDALVTLTALVARVVTHVSWISGGQPPLQYLPGERILAGVQLRQSLVSEGDSGFMFTTATWDDGSVQVSHLTSNQARNPNPAPTII